MFSRLSRGQRLLSTGRFERAAEELARAAEVSPADPAPRLYRAVALGWLARREEAADEATRAAALARRPAPVAFLAALLVADAGRHEKARELLEKAEAADPRNPYGKGIRSFLALRDGDGGAAVRKLLHGDMPPTDEYMLRLLRFLEEPRRPTFEAPPSAPPSEPRWRDRSEARRQMSAGVSLVTEERHAEAVEALRRAASLSPTDPDVRACLGEALFLAGDRAAAAAEFELSIEFARRDRLKLDEQAAAIEGYLGRIDYLEGRGDRAVERLARAVGAGSPYPDDRYFLGLCHWWRGESRAAYLAWIRLRRDDPDFPHKRLRELLGLPRGKPPGPFAWVRALWTPLEAVS